MSKQKQSLLEGLLNRSGWLTKCWANAKTQEDRDKRNTKRKGTNREIAELIFPSEEEEEEPGKPLPKKLKEAHYSGLGLLLWFMHNSWNPKDLDEYTEHLDKTIERIRREKFSAVDFFIWICDGRHENWYANKKIPYEISDGKVDFSTWEKKWWERFNTFIRTLHKWDLEPSMLLFSRYNYWAFKNAKEGRIEFWGAEGLRKQVRLTRRLIRIVQKYYGDDYMPWLKPNNELSNHGNDEAGALFARWHVKLFDGIQDLFPEKDDVSKWVLNTDKCEWIVIPFAYDETFEFRGYKLGESRFLRNGRRKYVDEIHRISCEENVKDGRVDMALKANFPKSTPQRCHEDCGCGIDEDDNPIGKGAGFYPYFVGNHKQTFDAQKLLHSKYKEKNRSVISVYLNLDCLKKADETKGVYMEHCKVEELDWGRPKAFIDGVKAGLKA